MTTGARHDNQPYLEQIERVRNQYRLKIREATADRGYGSAAIIRALQQQGIETYIPLWSGRVGNSKYLHGELVYEKEHDRFRCPQGKYLSPNPAIIENHKRYVSNSEDCRDCPRASTCPARTRGRSPQRFLLRNLDQDLFEQVQGQMRDPTFRQNLSERMWKMEGLFAEAKQHHNLSRAKYRGRSKVQIQAYLSGITQNLKSLLLLCCGWLIGRWMKRPNRTTSNPSKYRGEPDFFNSPGGFLTQLKWPGTKAWFPSSVPAAFSNIVVPDEAREVRQPTSEALERHWYLVIHAKRERPTVKSIERLCLSYPIVATLILAGIAPFNEKCPALTGFVVWSMNSTFRELKNRRTAVSSD